MSAIRFPDEPRGKEASLFAYNRTVNAGSISQWRASPGNLR
jgi:hypothetical protein